MAPVSVPLKMEEHLQQYFDLMTGKDLFQKIDFYYYSTKKLDRSSDFTVKICH